MTTKSTAAARSDLDRSPAGPEPRTRPRQTAQERSAFMRSYEAQKAVRVLKSQIDATLDMWRARMTQLNADLNLARRAVGADSTRPHYTDDLQKLHRQERRYELLAGAIFSKEL